MQAVSRVQQGTVSSADRLSQGRRDSMAASTPNSHEIPVYSFFAWGGQHDGVGRVGLGPPVGFFPLFAPEFSQQKKIFFPAEITKTLLFGIAKKNLSEITMSTLPKCLLFVKWVI